MFVSYVTRDTGVKKILRVNRPTAVRAALSALSGAASKAAGVAEEAAIWPGGCERAGSAYSGDVWSVVPANAKGTLLNLKAIMDEVYSAPKQATEMIVDSKKEWLVRNAEMQLAAIRTRFRAHLLLDALVERGRAERGRVER